MVAISSWRKSSHSNAPPSCRVRASPKARLSHGSANTSSPLLRGGEAGP